VDSHFCACSVPAYQRRQSFTAISAMKSLFRKSDFIFSRSEEVGTHDNDPLSLFLFLSKDARIVMPSAVIWTASSAFDMTPPWVTTIRSAWAGW
jgi:hypothetical protein